MLRMRSGGRAMFTHAAYLNNSSVAGKLILTRLRNGILAKECPANHQRNILRTSICMAALPNPERDTHRPHATYITTIKQYT
jgi:hypothetical protein